MSDEREYSYYYNGAEHDDPPTDNLLPPERLGVLRIKAVHGGVYAFNVKRTPSWRAAAFRDRGQETYKVQWEEEYKVLWDEDFRVDDKNIHVEVYCFNRDHILWHGVTWEDDQ